MSDLFSRAMQMAASLLGGRSSEASFHIALPSGLDIESERMYRRGRLLTAQGEAIVMFPADSLPDGVLRTKCNFGVAHIAARMGCYDLSGLTANQMLHKLSMGVPGWREDEWQRATLHAMRGGLAVIGWPHPDPKGHGHVVTVSPLEAQTSGTWGCAVPMVANIGKPPNDFKRLSGAFLLEHRPDLRCFLWGEP